MPINAVDHEKIKLFSVLSKLPQKEQVFWLVGMRSEPALQNRVNINLPPSPIIDTIKGYAGESGLELAVPNP